MKAVILCAGKGTRIREITEDEKPKPMVEIDGKPLLQHTIEHLSKFGIKEVLINLHHRGEKIEEYFGASHAGVDIKYYWEEELLGTAGALNQMKDELDDDFFVIYGDVISDIDLGELQRNHASSEALGTILVYSGEEDLSKSSIISLDEKNNIEAFIEKPSEEVISTFQDEIWTNAGIYCLSPEIIDFIGTGNKDFSYDVFPEILKSSNSLKGFKLPEETYWKEVGDPESYRELKKDVSNSSIEW